MSNSTTYSVLSHTYIQCYTNREYHFYSLFHRNDTVYETLTILHAHSSLTFSLSLCIHASFLLPRTRSYTLKKAMAVAGDTMHIYQNIHSVILVYNTLYSIKLRNVLLVSRDTVIIYKNVQRVNSYTDFPRISKNAVSAVISRNCMESSV